MRATGTTLIDEAGLGAALELHRTRRKEATRLHGLTDRWLGEALRRIACQGTKRGDGNHALVEATMEAARRLGCASLPRGRLSGAGPAEFRAAATAALARAGSPGHAAPEDFLRTDPARGNPLLIGVDRVAPPDPRFPDAQARRVLDACTWLGIPRSPSWHPGMLPPSSDLSTLAGIAGLFDAGPHRGVSHA